MAGGGAGDSEPIDRETAEYATLDRALETALAPWRREGPSLTLLYSGGVDSGLLAWELRGRPRTTLFTVGLAGAPDLAAAEGSADALGLAWLGSEVAPTDLERSVRSVSGELEERPRGLRGLHLALAVAIERAPPGTILCGQGIDELFLGYAHFAGLSAAAAGPRAEDDLRRLVDVDWPATQRLARRFGRRIEAPFLDPGFVRAALSLPVEQRLPSPAPKGFWRRWARHRGLPAEIAERPKRAMQYGSGIDRWYRSYVKPG